jgi:hypothetical protein
LKQQTSLLTLRNDEYVVGRIKRTEKLELSILRRVWHQIWTKRGSQFYAAFAIRFKVELTLNFTSRLPSDFDRVDSQFYVALALSFRLPNTIISLLLGLKSLAVIVGVGFGNSLFHNQPYALGGGQVVDETT